MYAMSLSFKQPEVTEVLRAQQNMAKTNDNACKLPRKMPVFKKI